MTSTSHSRDVTRAPGSAEAVGRSAFRDVMFYALLLLCVVGLLAVHTAWSKTVTHDELWHVPVGLRNLRDGQFDVDRLNPPLARMWSAVPLLIMGVSTDHETFNSAAGKRFVEDHPTRFPLYFFAARCAHLVWWIAGGLIVTVWTWQLLGRDSALLAVLLYATCPNLLAHGSVVTPDAPLMCAFMATLYVCWRWCLNPTWGWAVLLGILLGVTQGVKFTGLLAYPLVVAAVLWVLVFRTNTAKSRFNVAGQGLLAGVLSLVVLAACYGFQGNLVPLNQYQFRAQAMQFMQSLFASIPSIRVPFPCDYLLGIDEQRFIMESPHPVFLDGQWSVTGFPHYYLMMLVWKIPHLLQVLFIAGLVRWLFFVRRPGQRKTLLILLIPILLVLIVSSREGMQLGVRYVLPILPLFIMIASASADWWALSSRHFRVALGMILCVLAVFSLRYHPSHLAYFNEFAGGPIGGRFHLLDSNLDWGQDLHPLSQELKARGWNDVSLAYFGTVPPELLGFKFELPPSWRPQPGRYAVSVNYVMGRPHVITQGDGASRGTDFQEFGYFRFFEPVQTVGGSIDLYELTPEDVTRWQAAQIR